MANVVTTVTIGDYRYTLWDNEYASANVTDKTKASYGALQTSVTHEGVTYALTSLNTCFQACTSLTAAPAIPSGVMYMFRCFYGCTSLTNAPEIPSSVTDIGQCFYNCTSLTTAPEIPSGVTDISGCFMYCRSLTGTIAVHGTPTSYNSCFYNTTLPIRLICSSDTILPTWKQVAATGNNGNVIAVYVENNPAPTATLNVTRVGSDGSTVPNESGEWAYVQVETTVSTDQAPDNVAQAPIITKDGSSVVPSTHASGTASYVDWVSLGDDKTHRIGATPRDLYKNGGEVIVTLAGTYSPMEFYTKPILNEHDEVIGYEGGVGASFGKHATREGVLDVAWDIESDGDVKANALSVTDGYPYCKDGTNVKVNGQTIGSADNLAYVLSRDQSEVAYTVLVGAGGNGVWYRRVGVIVELYIRAGANWGGTLPANQFTTLGTLPVGCRPAHDFQFSGNITGGNQHVQFNLDVDGTLKAYCNAAKAYFYAHTMYFTV